MYRLFVSPVVLGGGTAYFPPLKEKISLELPETRTFGSRVVYLRYRRVQDDNPLNRRPSERPPGPGGAPDS